MEQMDRLMSKAEISLNSRHFFGIKDDNGGNADCVRRTLNIGSVAADRVKELEAAGWSEDQIKDDLYAAVLHLKWDLRYMANRRDRP